MGYRMGQLPVIIGLGAVIFANAMPSRAERPRVDYRREIRPLLSNTCYACHGPDDDNREADLQLDTKAGAFGELPSGNVAVVPGDSAASELYRRLVAADADERMPPAEHDKRLTAAEIERVKQWIDEGADWNEHWAFVPPVPPQLPEVADAQWGRGAIDHFILARLEKEGLHPSAAADKTTLIRRVTLDLTGLPPAPDEVDRFLADNSPDAYERLVDRLFASPRYGEHRARYWLDAARYGDTHGLHLDNERSIWLYRDWVVAAYNKNMPFDQFTVEQLAGDLLPDATQEQRIATGFNRCHVTTNEGGSIQEEVYVRNTIDRVETTATVWLGLTAGCAACHDHKFDPLTRKEFYQLSAFFGSTAEDAMDGNARRYPPVVSLGTPAQEERRGVLVDQIAALERQIKEAEAAVAAAAAQAKARQTAANAGTEGQGRAGQAAATNQPPGAAGQPDVAALHAQVKELRAEQDALDIAIPTTLVMQQLPEPRDAFDLERGEYDKRGEKVEPAVPAFLPPLPDDGPADRLALARWLISGSHPLTARVTVNRLWQELFGIGIVETAEDFGAQGAWPSHPELLDWLAAELLHSGWDVRHMLRLMVTSAAYRQASATRPELLKIDPDNRLLARGPRFRMDAEMVRDSILAASGLLVECIGGKGVRPYQPAGIWEAVGYTTSNTADYQQDHGDALYRRSLYTFWKRTAPPPALTTLDAPTRETCVVRRTRTNTPLAALVLMNDIQVVEAARQLAERVLRETGDDPSGAITRAFRLATARQPRADEIDVLARFYQNQLAEFRADPESARQLIAVGESAADEALDPCTLAAWTMVTNVILNLDETVTKG